MKMRHIKFVWGGPEVIKGHWYFRLIGFYDRRDGHRDDGFAINVRGLLPWLLGAALAAWVLGAAALFWVWQRNSYNLLTYSDALFFPLRRADIHDKNGQALIARGTDALREKKWGEAMACLRQGLALHPHEWRARLTLAQLYVATNQRAMALRQLQEGLTNEFPGRAYLTGLFAIAEQGEDYEVVVQIAQRYLPMLQGDKARLDRRWLSAREFDALMGALRFEEALARAEAAEPGDLTREQRVLVLLQLRRPADALRALAEWRALPGADSAVVARLSVRAFREAGQFDEMERALEAMRAQAPADPRTLVYGVVQQALAGRDTPAKAALEDYLFRFGGSPQNLQLVAAPLAEIANLPLLERCAAAAAEHGFPAQPFQVLLVEAGVRGGDWNAAARTLAGMKPVVGRGAAQDQLWREWVQRLLDVVRGPSETASLNLAEFLRSRPWTIKVFQTTVEALRRANHLAAARDVLGLALANFPASAWVEKQRAEVAQEIAAQPAVPTSPVAAKRTPPEEGLFFQRLDASLSGEQWTVAGQLIRDARDAQPEPGWLSSRDGELRLAEMRVAQAQGERSRMLAATAVFLNGNAERTRQARELARAFYTKGDRESAIVLMTEVLRLSPDDMAARKLMSEWRPKPAQPTKAAAEPGLR